MSGDCICLLSRRRVVRFYLGTPFEKNMTSKEYKALQPGSVVKVSTRATYGLWFVAQTCEDLSTLRTHQWPANTTRLVQLLKNVEGLKSGLHTWIGDCDANRVELVTDRKITKKVIDSVRALI